MTKPKEWKRNLLSTTAVGWFRTGVSVSLLATVLWGIPSAKAADVLIDNGDVVWTDDSNIDGNVIVRAGSNIGLTISNGAKISSTGGYIADAQNSFGTVTISGAGSEWNIINPDPNKSRVLSVGGFGGIFGGTAALVVEDGGKVSSQYVNVAAGQQSKGTITVRGQGSVLTADEINIAGAYFTLNSGEVYVQDGGLITSNYALLENGQVSVSGAGSKWINSGAFDINDNFTVENGGEVTTGSTTLTKSDPVNGITMYVSGPESKFNVNGVLSIGTLGDVNLSVANGAICSRGRDRDRRICGQQQRQFDDRWQD